MTRPLALALLVTLSPLANAQDDIGVKLGQRVAIAAELDERIALKDLIAQLEHDHGVRFVALEEKTPVDWDQTFSLKRTIKGLTVREALDLSLGSLGLTFVVRERYVEILTVPLPATAPCASQFFTTRVDFVGRTAGRIRVPARGCLPRRGWGGSPCRR